MAGTLMLKDSTMTCSSFCSRYFDTSRVVYTMRFILETILKEIQGDPVHLQKIQGAFKLDTDGITV